MKIQNLKTTDHVLLYNAKGQEIGEFTGFVLENRKIILHDNKECALMLNGQIVAAIKNVDHYKIIDGIEYMKQEIKKGI